MFNIKLSIDGDSRIATKPISSGNSRIFYFSDLTTSRAITLKKNRKNKSIFEERISSIALSNNQLLMLGNASIFVLELCDDNSSIRLVKQINNKDNFTFSRRLGENIFLSVFYDFHPLDAESKHVWAVFDLKSLEITRKKVMPDNDVIFSYFVNQLHSTYNDKIAHALSTNYKIFIYDSLFNKIDSIVSDEFKFDRQLLVENNLTRFNSKEQISRLKKFDDSLFTRMRKVYYCDDSTVYALIKVKSSNRLRMDKWGKTNNSWERTGSGDFTVWYEEGKAYNKDDISTASDFYQNVFDLNHVQGDTFELWYYPFIPTVNTESFNVNKDYYAPQNDCIVNKESYIGIKQISITDRTGL
ncbi:MAG: hypothetical protein P8P74_02940 [Crocinitomicaceae bacterium]|nr:hypothetical protein [Crocinitomicaceae bacterium]